MREDVDLVLTLADAVDGRDRRRRAARAWAARRSRPRCCGSASAASASTCSTRRTPARSASCRRQLDLERTLFVSASKSGSTLETRSHTDYFWKLAPRGAQWVAITDPGSELEELAREREFRADLPGRADDRRPLLGALAVRARAGGAARRRPAAAARPRAARWPRPAASTTATRASSSASRSARAGRTAATRSASPNAHGFGLWVEQLLAESTGKEGKGLVPAPGESPDGPDRQAQEVRLPIAVRARPGVLPLGVRHRGRRLDPRHQPVRPAGRAGGEGPDERGARRRRRRARAPRARSTSCSRGAEDGDYVCIQAFVNPTAGGRGGARARSPTRAREATGCVVTHGFGPRYLHSTGQLHKGGAEHRPLPPGGRRLRRRAEDPGPAVRLRPADPRPGRRRLRRRCASAAAASPRPHGGCSRCSSG